MTNRGRHCGSLMLYRPPRVGKEKWDLVRGEAVGRVVLSGGNELKRVINSPHVRRSCTALISAGNMRDKECICTNWGEFKRTDNIVE